ncbi:MAG TPA: hypothetical protein VLB50_00720 [Ignavibacteriaceae bacterium]|nr:hypothetical protein [Ignavibacteriaceae bacterium]
MKLKLLVLFFFILVSVLPLIAQDEPDSVEVYLIDSFVTPEVPHTFVLSFFTSAAATSQVIIDNNYTYSVSDELTESHKKDIDISKLEFTTKNVPFVILVKDSLGREFKSDTYEFELPEELKIEGGSNFLLLCLFGTLDFVIPSPVYVKEKEDDYFSLTKEIPLISIRGSNYRYPLGYFSAEYSHIFNAPVKNFLRVGYKHIIPLPGIEYVSPGFNGFTNFKGFNGISPELSLGLFRIANTFTVYARYRFNVKPGETGSEFHEFSLGLYSSFFSLYF